MLNHSTIHHMIKKIIQNRNQDPQYHYPHTLQNTGTVGENIIATTKMRNNFCYRLKMVIFPILR